MKLLRVGYTSVPKPGKLRVCARRARVTRRRATFSLLQSVQLFLSSIVFRTLDLEDLGRVSTTIPILFQGMLRLQ